ncbi:MAG TPA: VOC family protein [Mycobacteriales bacterium]|nr:VOC family protein [Mycobacteriales bacterium]
MTITGIHTIGVPVTDQDRALAFYTTELGFEVRLDVPLGRFGGRWIEIAPPGSPVTIALVPAGEKAPAGVETGIRLSTPDGARTHRELQGRGVTVGELLLWKGVPPMFTVRDIDGNGLEIVEAR